MFLSVPRMEQAWQVSRWIRELAKVTRVAICSGNHDNAGRQVSADRAPVYGWFRALGREPNIITDGATDTVNDLIVTTVPYHCSKGQKMVWLDRGLSLRRQRGIKWLVLHHVPPKTYPDALGEVAEAADLLQLYRPEYFISGHSHQFPYFIGNGWAQKIGEVKVFVPGQLLGAPVPNHIVLNTESRRSELANVESGVGFLRYLPDIPLSIGKIYGQSAISWICLPSQDPTQRHPGSPTIFRFNNLCVASMRSDWMADKLARRGMNRRAFLVLTLAALGLPLKSRASEPRCVICGQRQEDHRKEVLLGRYTVGNVGHSSCPRNSDTSACRDVTNAFDPKAGDGWWN